MGWQEKWCSHFRASPSSQAHPRIWVCVGSGIRSRTSKVSSPMHWHPHHPSPQGWASAYMTSLKYGNYRWNWRPHAWCPASLKSAFLCVSLLRCGSWVTAALGAPTCLSAEKLWEISTDRKDLNLWTQLSYVFTLLFTLCSIDNAPRTAEKARQQLQTYLLPDCNLGGERDIFPSRGSHWMTWVICQPGTNYCD